MQKTVREWGEELLPEPYKSQFMENFNNPECNLEFGNELIRAKERFLLSAFSWGKSPQGFDYWSKVYSWVISIDELPIPTPTERQTVEALLDEYDEFCRDNYSLEISDRIKQDFLTSKYGKG